jgi:hypothetical protein
MLFRDSSRLALLEQVADRIVFASRRDAPRPAGERVRPDGDDRRRPPLRF